MLCLRLSIFNTYWNILKRNYQDKTHNEQDYKLYFSIFREYHEQDFINAIKEVLKHQSYFPRIDEIVKYLPNCDVPNWIENYEVFNAKELSDSEKVELDEILEELECD